jgi:hypothetical protein
MIVIFDSRSAHWTRHFLHKDINHVYYALNDGVGYKIVEHCITHTEVTYQKELPTEWTELLSIDALGTSQRSWNCVASVKKALGIKNIFVQTPYQLFNFLTRY